MTSYPNEGISTEDQKDISPDGPCEGVTVQYTEPYPQTTALQPGVTAACSVSYSPHSS